MGNRPTVTMTDEQAFLASALSAVQIKMATLLAKGGYTQHAAYIEAGGQAKSRSSQDSDAHRIMKDPNFQAFYQSLLKTAHSRAVMDREEALMRLTNMSRVTVNDILEFYNVTTGEDEFGLPITEQRWKVRDLSKVPEYVAASIKSITETRNGPKVELHDSADALKQLRAMSGWDSATKYDVTSGGQSIAPTVVERRIVDPKARKGFR